MRRFCVARGRRGLWRQVLAGVIAVGVAAGWMGESLAEPLAKEACDQLAAERQALTGMGVEENMAKGPEWAAANLSASALDLIKRYITVSEQLKFRCRPAPALAAGAPAPAKQRALARRPQAAKAPHAAARTPSAETKGPARPAAGGAPQKRQPMAGKSSATGDRSGAPPVTINATVH